MPGQLIRETNPAQGFAPSLVPQHEDVNGDYKTTGEKNPLPVSVEDSGAAAQTDVQYRKQKMIQGIASAVVIASTGTADSAWIDTDGFHEIGLTLSSDAETGTSTNRMDLLWSHDNTNVHGEEKTVMSEALSRYRVANVTTKARYVKMRVFNKDTTGPHTMSAWAYLKV